MCHIVKMQILCSEDGTVPAARENATLLKRLTFVFRNGKESLDRYFRMI